MNYYPAFLIDLPIAAARLHRVATEAVSIERE